MAREVFLAISDRIAPLTQGTAKPSISMAPLLLAMARVLDLDGKGHHMSQLLPRRWKHLLVVAAIAVSALGYESSTSTALADQSVALENDWIIEPAQARTLIEGGALVLDARAPDLKESEPLPNAVPVVWQDLAEDGGKGNGNLLTDDAALTAKLQELGVSQARPVVVVADPLKGWGEDGRLVWTLRTLGHSKAVLINGGLPALLAGGTLAIKAPEGKGDFVVNRTTAWKIDREEIRSHLNKNDLVLIDAREPREYAGETPYGEARGGHVPGARHVYYKEFLDENGNLLPQEKIAELLQSKGISKGAQIASYCTGGIRSGWFTAVLTDLGYNAKNYAGSMWEWSSSPADQYPLTVETN